MGAAGLTFRLGPDWSVLDDIRMGYNSGKRADVLVIDSSWDDGILMKQTSSPPIHTFVSQLLATEYREVYKRGGYRILVRHP